VRCDRFREAASARLDNEPIGMSASALEHHLTSCLDCARWLEAATRATRLARLGAPPVPDLTDAITALVVSPARRVLRRRHVLRGLLLVAGVVQLVIGIPAITGDSIGMAMSMHAAHEAAAWNIAIGVAFLAAAWLPRRAAGLIPLLSTFTLVLGILSIHDLAAGAVTLGRLATHLAVLAGLLVLIALDRAERALPPGRSASFAGRRGERSADDGESPDLRGVA
jgi:predicted anti-sigma-YlaC factor YlaD